MNEIYSFASSLHDFISLMTRRVLKILE